MIKRILLGMLLFAAGFAAAGDRHYAVLSLVGDRLLVVTREMSTGSRLDKNSRQVVELGDNALDRSMVLAVDEAIHRAQPQATTTLLAPKDPKLFPAARDADARIHDVLEAVRPLLAQSDATHLVLVTKRRHPAMLQLRDGSVGSGFLDGVGFYVDHGMPRRSSENSEAGDGFISPFAYMTVSLVEIASGRVLSQERVLGSAPYMVGSANVSNAWAALTPQEKADRLAEVMKSEADRAVPALLGSR